MREQAVRIGKGEQAPLEGGARLVPPFLKVWWAMPCTTASVFLTRWLSSGEEEIPLRVRLLALGDVDIDPDQPEKLAARREARPGAGPQGAVLAGRIPVATFDLDRPPFARCRNHAGRDPGGILGVHGIAPAEAFEVLNPPELAELSIEIQALPHGVAGPDHDRGFLGHHPEPGLQLAELLLGGVAGLLRPELFEAEADLPRDVEREPLLAVVEGVNLAVIGHELPDHPAGRQQRDECKPDDALIVDPPLDPVRLVRQPDVGDEDRFRVDIARRPGRMPGEGGAVAFREAAPGDELHHARHGRRGR